jgi:hypothetical protein
MRVFVVMDNDWESNTILGIFATRELAESAIQVRGKEPYARLFGWAGRHEKRPDEWYVICDWYQADIEEHEVEGS